MHTFPRQLTQGCKFCTDVSLMPGKAADRLRTLTCQKVTKPQDCSGRWMHGKRTVAYTSLAPQRDCLALLASHPSGLGQKAPWRIQLYSCAARQAGMNSRELERSMAEEVPKDTQNLNNQKGIQNQTACHTPKHSKTETRRRISTSKRQRMQ